MSAFCLEINKKCTAKLLLQGFGVSPAAPSPFQCCSPNFSNFTPRCCFISPVLKMIQAPQKWLSAECRAGALLLFISSGFGKTRKKSLCCCKAGQSCGTAPSAPLSSEQNKGGDFRFYRWRFSCQSTHNYLQPWGWGCECKKKMDKITI